MSEQLRKKGLVASAAVLVVLVLVGLLVGTGSADDTDDTPKKESTTTTEATPEEGLTDEEIERLVDEAFGRQGFDPDEVLTGDDVVFDDVAEERGSASFSNVTLRTRQDVANFLNGDSPESIAVRERVQAALADKPGELDRAMSGEGYVPVQFTVAVQYFGTTYFNGSDVIVAGDPRQTDEDDILWLFITKEGVIVAKASIRADCANPEFDKIIPVRPTTPPAPPISEPPTDKPDEPEESDKPKCPWNPALPPDHPECLEPKGPEESTNNNPDIPEQVRKPSPSPDNQSEASKPPSQPVDTPTGCSGTCGEDPSFESPPATSPPSSQPGRGSSNGGTNTTTPPTTVAPAPAPPTTAPPTTNPPPPPPGSF